MSKQVMERKASDNKYLHKDFHLTADIGIAYVGENYGDDAVKQYLSDYAKSFYQPLIEEIKKNGLAAFEKYLIKIYKAEECEDALSTALTDNRLNVKIRYCPAVRYMKSQGHTPSRWYIETVRTTYKVIAEECSCVFSLISYDEENGSCEFIIGY